MGDTALALEDPGALQLDLLRSEALEQAAPLAEEHRDDMELELVEDTGCNCELRRSGAVDQHVPVARGLLGPSHRTRDVAQVGDQRPLPQIGGVVAGEDEDRRAVVVVAAPATGRLEGPPTGDDRAGGHQLVHDLAVDAARTADGFEVDVAVLHRPLVQAVSAVAEAVVRSLIRPGDEPVEGHGHVENGCGHGVPFVVLVSARSCCLEGGWSPPSSCCLVVAPQQLDGSADENSSREGTAPSPRLPQAIDF